MVLGMAGGGLDGDELDGVRVKDALLFQLGGDAIGGPVVGAAIDEHHMLSPWMGDSLSLATASTAWAALASGVKARVSRASLRSSTLSCLLLARVFKSDTAAAGCSRQVSRAKVSDQARASPSMIFFRRVQISVSLPVQPRPPGLQVGAVFTIVAFGDLDEDVLALRQRHVTHGDGDLTTHGG